MIKDTGEEVHHASFQTHKTPQQLWVRCCPAATAAHMDIIIIMPHMTPLLQPDNWLWRLVHTARVSKSCHCSCDDSNASNLFAKQHKRINMPPGPHHVKVTPAAMVYALLKGDRYAQLDRCVGINIYCFAAPAGTTVQCKSRWQCNEQDHAAESCTLAEAI